MRQRISPAATATIGLSAALLLSGCYQGVDSTVNHQPPTGNGAHAAAQGNPKLQVQNATLIIAPGTPGPGKLIFSLVNQGTEDDTLQQITTDPGSSVALPNGGIPVSGMGLVTVGADTQPQVTVTGINTTPSSFVNVTFSFAKGGQVKAQVLTVPPTGYYAPGGSNL